MMEIDVTHLVRDADCFEFSASMTERGSNAGPETWANAKEEAALKPLLSDDQLDDAREYFADFGAWSREELAAMSAQDINALTIQFVAGDVREANSLCPADNDDGVDWDAYQRLANEGRISGNLSASEGRVFFLMSH